MADRRDDRGSGGFFLWVRGAVVRREEEGGGFCAVMLLRTVSPVLLRSWSSN